MYSVNHLEEIEEHLVNLVKEADERIVVPICSLHIIRI